MVHEPSPEDPWCQSGSSPPERGTAVRFPPAENAGSSPLLNVREAANRLKVSQSWIRRHIAELPSVRVGSLVRFDSALLLRQFRGTQPLGNRLKTGGTMSLQLRRYQRGYVYKTGRKTKVWYGMYREDVQTAEGTIARHQRNVRLGMLSELPTKNAAQNKLLDLMKDPDPSVEMTFSELVTRWQELELPTIKKTSTADTYKKILRSYVLPTFGGRRISAITRNDIQTFLMDQAKSYSRSSVHGMKVAISKVMGWALDNDWIKKNPTIRLKTPQDAYCGGKKVVRNKELKPDEVKAIADRLKEPYSSLVWFLAVTGLRIGEAVGIKWSDFKDNVLHVQRRVYEGQVDTPKSKKSVRRLPIPAELLQRLRRLGTRDWVFQARNGSPINQSNALRRYLRPVVEELGITLGGWHDFRHSQSTVMRLGDVPREVRAAILGHSVNQTEDYGEVNTVEFQRPLAHVANELLRNVTKTADAA